jgi:hypothetical protein
MLEYTVLAQTFFVDSLALLLLAVCTGCCDVADSLGTAVVVLSAEPDSPGIAVMALSLLTFSVSPGTAVVVLFTRRCSSRRFGCGRFVSFGVSVTSSTEVGYAASYRRTNVFEPHVVAQLLSPTQGGLAGYSPCLFGSSLPSLICV